MLDLGPIFARQLILVTGKGGIGKTLVTAAIGQAAAAAGRRVLMVESSAREQLAPLFGRPPTRPGDEPEKQLLPNLASVNIDAATNFREYIVKYLGKKFLYDTVFNHKVVKSFTSTIPGLAEVMLLGRMFYHCELAPSPRPDLVLFDGFSSGHFLSLMTTPEAILAANIGGPLMAETARVKTFLSDRERCGILVVGVAEPLVISECLDFVPALAAKAPVGLLSLVVNRLPPAPPVGAPPALAAFATRRYQTAQAAMAELDKGLASLRVGGAALRVDTLPELGFIDEPLPAGFGQAFLDASDWRVPV